MESKVRAKRNLFLQKKKTRTKGRHEKFLKGLKERKGRVQISGRQALRLWGARSAPPYRKDSKEKAKSPISGYGGTEPDPNVILDRFTL